MLTSRTISPTRRSGSSGFWNQRSTPRGPVSSPNFCGDEPLTVGDLVIDVARRTVTRADSTVHLTPTEWGLLSALVTHAGRTVTHQQLFRAVWGSAHGDAQQYLRVYIAHLRRKVEVDPYAPRRIVTEPGVGYRFEPDA